MGYEPVRADEIPKPGVITGQIIQHLIDDALVVADLADYNPNVFYELAVRHAVRKPVVQIKKKGQQLPFDVITSRTIDLDISDLDSIEECKNKLRKQIASVEKDPSEADNPISNAIDLQATRKSGEPVEKMVAEILTSIQDVKSTVLEEMKKQASTRYFGIGQSPAQPLFSLQNIPSDLTKIPIVDFKGIPIIELPKVSVVELAKKEEKKEDSGSKKSS